MMTTTFKPDPAQTARLAAILRENAPIHAAIGDTAFAATCANVASALELLTAFASLPALIAAPVPASPEPPTKPPRLSRHRQVEIVRTWFLNRQEAYRDKTPPSEARDIEDARNEILGVSRDVDSQAQADRMAGWQRQKTEVAEFVMAIKRRSRRRFLGIQCSC